MNRGTAAAGSAIFFVVAPGFVVGLVPWWLSHWQFRSALWDRQPVRWLGAALITAGLAGVLDSFTRFALEGRGTPAPILPPDTLVVRGLYRYVRNPMYVMLLAVLLGQGLFFGSASILIYAAIAWLITDLFVRSYEEPTLRRTFGGQYEAYCSHVRRWLPRASPWKGPASDSAQS